jgi:hypothetical protein
MLEIVVGTALLYALLMGVYLLATRPAPSDGRVVPGWRRGALAFVLALGATSSCATARPTPRLDLVVEHLCGVTATPQGPNWTSVFSYLNLWPTVAPADKDAVVVEALRQCRDRAQAAAKAAAAKPAPAPNATPTPAPTPSPGG